MDFLSIEGYGGPGGGSRDEKPLFPVALSRHGLSRVLKRGGSRLAKQDESRSAKQDGSHGAMPAHVAKSLAMYGAPGTRLFSTRLKPWAAGVRFRISAKQRPACS